MSVELAKFGSCDTPTCSGGAETITPEGYVCQECARRIEVAYREAEERDLEVWRAER